MASAGRRSKPLELMTIEELASEIARLRSNLALQREVMNHPEVRAMESWAHAHGFEYSAELVALAVRAKKAAS